jgi:hypothetical protein
MSWIIRKGWLNGEQIKKVYKAQFLTNPILKYKIKNKINLKENKKRFESTQVSLSSSWLGSACLE